MIATHSPDQVLKVGLFSSPSERKPQKGHMAGVSGPFSPVQSCSELSRTRACFPFRVFRGKNHRCLLLSNGGEGGILVPPFPASADESYTSAIIPRVLDAYKRFLSSATVSIVSPIRWSSAENGISGISSNWLQLWPSHWRQSEQHQLHDASSARAASEIHWEEKEGSLRKFFAAPLRSNEGT